MLAGATGSSSSRDDVFHLKDEGRVAP